ncbi:MAG: sarcosine oxidase subunit gamma [Proteobacteria bacterium]|nr:sarcosine oxidase subunit gamma [Pseudomonadota bacterium]
MAKKIVAVARSPLAAHSAINTETYRQQEIAPLTKIIIRGKSDDSAFMQAIKSVLDAELPLTPNSTVELKDPKKQARILWLGPEEWLLWTSADKHGSTLDALQTATREHHAAIIDVSDYYTIIRISGSNAKGALMQGCPLDLRERAFSEGNCAQSHYRNTGILLYCGKDYYDVQVRWSFANYLWEYFATVGE